MFIFVITPFLEKMLAVAYWTESGNGEIVTYLPSYPHTEDNYLDIIPAIEYHPIISHLPYRTCSHLYLLLNLPSKSEQAE